MKCVDQNHDKGCFQAAVASVLELPIAEVPDFCAPGFNGRDWWGGFLNWCKSRGLMAVEFRLREREACFAELPDGLICILSGLSPRGINHSVVAQYSGGKFEIVHDPHSSRLGIVGFPQDILVFVRSSGF
jgi:hypothetical protein